MSNSRKKDNTSTAKKRKTIGVVSDFSSSTVRGYINILLSGIIDESKKHNFNVICFAGEHLVDSKNEFLAQRNIVYRMAGQQNINGVIVVSNSIFSDETTIKDLEAICHYYRPLPIVSIGAKLKGIAIERLRLFVDPKATQMQYRD
ncbi:MAG: hypothetical protein ABSC53_08670 [Bacteroidota bacterium]